MHHYLCRHYIQSADSEDNFAFSFSPMPQWNSILGTHVNLCSWVNLLQSTHVPRHPCFFLFSISLPPFISLWNQFFQFSSPKFSISQALFPDTFPSCLKGNLTWEISSVYNIVPNVRAFIHKFVTMFTTQYSNPPKLTQIHTVNFTGCESRGLPRALLCWSRLLCPHLALCKFNLVSPNLRNVRPGPEEKEKNGFFLSKKIMILFT